MTHVRLTIVLATSTGRMGLFEKTRRMFPAGHHIASDNRLLSWMAAALKEGQSPSQSVVGSFSVSEMYEDSKREDIENLLTACRPAHKGGSVKRSRHLGRGVSSLQVRQNFTW